jgi:hypothetical protein
MSSRSSLIFVLLTAAVVCLGLWFGKGIEVTAVVTALYAVVVFFQLGEMRRQHDDWKADQAEQLELQSKRKPVLALGQHYVRKTIESDNKKGIELGEAFYINCEIVNEGKSMALNCQPVVSGYAILSPDGRWKRQDDWIHLGLVWALDELNALRGEPTMERALVPQRPYQFDLGKISTYLPKALFALRTLLMPNAQACVFESGDHCFEVTVYAENAEPVKAWYTVTVDANLRSHTPLKVGKLISPPWS